MSINLTLKLYICSDKFLKSNPGSRKCLINNHHYTIILICYSLWRDVMKYNSNFKSDRTMQPVRRNKIVFFHILFIEIAHIETYDYIQNCTSSS